MTASLNMTLAHRRSRDPMKAVSPTKLVCPDGVEREVRFTLGAQRRIHERFGGTIQDALNKHGDGVLAELVYLCMYDGKGQPPADLTLVEFAEMLPGGGVETFAVLLSAISQGQVPKEQAEALIQKALEMSRTGFISGASAESALASTMMTSGISAPESSTPSASDGGSASDPGTSGPEPSPQLS